MTVKKNTAEATKLQQLYKNNPHARILLDHLAQRGKNPKNSETSVEAAYGIIAAEASDATPALARGVLEALAEIGCGNFVVGRRGWPTRIVWSGPAINAGKVARNDKLDERTTDASGSAKLVEVEYPLREDLRLTFHYPADLTEKEAERIAKFITSLPRE